MEKNNKIIKAFEQYKEKTGKKSLEAVVGFLDSLEDKDRLDALDFFGSKDTSLPMPEKEKINPIIEMFAVSSIVFKTSIMEQAAKLEKYLKKQLKEPNTSPVGIITFNALMSRLPAEIEEQRKDAVENYKLQQKSQNIESIGTDETLE